MKLFEFDEICYGVDIIHEIMVIDYEPAQEELKNPESLETLLTLKSCFKAGTYLKPEYANAEVEQIYALGQDRFLVTIKEIHDVDVWIPKPERTYYRINFETMSVEKFTAGNTSDEYRNDDNIFADYCKASETLEKIKAILYTERRC